MKIQKLVFSNFHLIESHDFFVFEKLILFQFGLLVFIQVNLQETIIFLYLRKQEKIKFLWDESFGYPIYSLWEIHSRNLVRLRSIYYNLVFIEAFESDVWPVETYTLGFLFAELL